MLCLSAKVYLEAANSHCRTARVSIMCEPVVRYRREVRKYVTFSHHTTDQLRVSPFIVQLLADHHTSYRDRLETTLYS